MAERLTGRQLAAGLLAAALLALTGCGDDDEGSASREPTTPPAPKRGPGGEIIVPLVEQNNSGASGTATLSARGDAASVTIELKGADGRYQAHVHDVSCERYRHIDGVARQVETVTEGLSNVTGGSAKSDLMEPPSAYTGGGFSINVHEYSAPYPVIACGDLSAP
jgi:hypothetical protein